MAKVNIVIHSYPPDFGAAPFFFQDIAWALKKDGHDVEIMTAHPFYPTNRIQKEYRGKWIVEEEVNGIKVRRHWFSTGQNASKIARLFGMISLGLSFLGSFPHLLKRKPEVFLIQTPPLLQPFTALIFAKLLGAKVYLNVSDLWPSAIADLGLLSKKSLTYSLLSKFERFFYRSSDKLFAQSEEIRDHILAATSLPSTLCRTGVDTSKFEKKLSYSRSNGEPLKLVYTGVLGVAHGLFNLCQRTDFKSFNCELHIYGDGFEAKAIKNYIDANPDSGIFLHPTVSFSEIPQLLQSFDAALICQRAHVYGTVPAKMYESLAVGLPILFNGAGEGAEMIKKYECGLVSCPESIEEFQKNLCTLQDKPIDELMKMGDNGRKLAVSQLEREVHIHEIAKSLKTVFHVEVNSKPIHKHSTYANYYNSK
ncbi:glycosyltransferase family 4 protein [Sediminitomix flava]|uniref:Glycosyltransferase involved in cell wall biosynthesis n=1 Tax=Sediminitomix flava TaxID=379075 RepID=A0A315ZB98_SEDFL|nr:glycosyltransferase family 4 protein [Sediminitomix flava]PWJ42572.1 glycosyltransferase involved in cell wall biosynthesis [Sediminitomix flava]